MVKVRGEGQKSCKNPVWPCHAYLNPPTCRGSVKLESPDLIVGWLEVAQNYCTLNRRHQWWVLPETNIFAPENGLDWKTILSFWRPPFFQVLGLLVSGRGPSFSAKKNTPIFVWQGDRAPYRLMFWEDISGETQAPMVRWFRWLAACSRES